MTGAAGRAAAGEQSLRWSQHSSCHAVRWGPRSWGAAFRVAWAGRCCRPRAEGCFPASRGAWARGDSFSMLAFVVPCLGKAAEALQRRCSSPSHAHNHCAHKRGVQKSSSGSSSGQGCRAPWVTFRASPQSPGPCPLPAPPRRSRARRCASPSTASTPPPSSILQAHGQHLYFLPRASVLSPRGEG